MDDAVANDPVGIELYRIGWEEKSLPYKNEEWFIAEARKAWEKLPEGYRTGRSFKTLADFMPKYIYDEKILASMAALRISSRKMPQDEYLSWARKLKINVESPDAN